MEILQSNDIWNCYRLIAPTLGAQCNDELKISFTNLKDSFIYIQFHNVPHTGFWCMEHEKVEQVEEKISYLQLQMAMVRCDG